MIYVHENLILIPANDSKDVFFFEKMPCNTPIDIRKMSKVSDALWLTKSDKEYMEFTKWMCENRGILFSLTYLIHIV